MEKENRSPESTQKGRRKSKRLSIGDALKLHTPVSYSIYKFIRFLSLRFKNVPLVNHGYVIENSNVFNLILYLTKFRIAKNFVVKIPLLTNLNLEKFQNAHIFDTLGIV